MGRSRMRAAGATPVLVVLLVGLVGCTSTTAAERPVAAPSSSTAAPSPPPPPPPPPVRWPLTGVESGGPIDRPALAVKVENSAEARPQSGLAEADLVWEQVVEGGITRFVAVYHSTLPGEIGPVRSVRPMDVPITAPLKGVMAFSGGQPDFLANLGRAGLQLVSHDSGAAGFYRVGHRSAPHNVYADPAALLAQADPRHRAAPAAQFTVAEPGVRPTAVTRGRGTRTVELALSTVSRPRWSWDGAARAWLRWEGPTPAVGPQGFQFRARNVVVLRVQVVDTAYVDAVGNPVPDAVLVGSGDALVATGGATVAARWSKGSLAEPVRLTLPGGAPVQLAPGNTWVELVDTGGGAVVLQP
jgi:Protein of unknown function (DUF3048) N-terminal domain/Protein of unknown function (DUF3048) C-terminal domain